MVYSIAAGNVAEPVFLVDPATGLPYGGGGSPMVVTGSGTAGTAATGVLTVQGIASMTPVVVGGNVASGATDSGNPVKIGGVYNSATPTLTAGQRGDMQLWSDGCLRSRIFASASTSSDATSNTTTAYQLAFNGSSLLPVVGQYGFNGTTWDRLRANTNGLVTQGSLSSARVYYTSGTAGGILNNTTTAVTMFAAGGASVRTYLSDLTISTDALGAATIIAIRDGAGGTVLWVGKVQTTGWLEPVTVRFNTPLQGTANTLMEIVTITATVTGSVYVTANGFQGT